MNPRIVLTPTCPNAAVAVAHAAVLAAAMMGLACAGCRVAPTSFNKVKAAREGSPIGRVAVVYCKHYAINLGGAERLHPFDVHKYDKIYLKLVTDGLIRPEDVFVPEEISREDLLRVHTSAYLDSLADPRVVAAAVESDLLSLLPSAAVDAGMLAPMRRATGGTLLAARRALDYGVGVNLGGGYHHAKADRGEGFNIYADMAVAIRAIQAERLVGRVLIVDLDVHQGNGSAEIFAGDDSVFTFSMHQGNIYPHPKARGDLDVELPVGTGDQLYLTTLSTHLARLILEVRPQIVFLQAGCDTLTGDPLASLKMTPEGVVRRDGMVIDTCVSRGIPVVMTLGGGYSQDAWRVQSASVARTIRRHGLAGAETLAAPRKPTLGERLYTK